MKPLNTFDYRRQAMKRLPRGMFEYIGRGTEDEALLREVRSSLDAAKLHQHVLNDVSDPDTSMATSGEKLPAPMVVSPTAVAGLVWHDGEVQPTSSGSCARRSTTAWRFPGSRASPTSEGRCSWNDVGPPGRPRLDAGPAAGRDGRRHRLPRERA